MITGRRISAPQHDQNELPLTQTAIFLTIVLRIGYHDRSWEFAHTQSVHFIKLKRNYLIWNQRNSVVGTTQQLLLIQLVRTRHTHSLSAGPIIAFRGRFLCKMEDSHLYRTRSSSEHVEKSIGISLRRLKTQWKFSRKADYKFKANIITEYFHLGSN